MPVNLIDIQNKLNDFSAQARARKEKIAVRHQEVTNLVEAYAHRGDELRDRLDRAAELVPRLRCAVPGDEPLNIASPALPCLKPLPLWLQMGRRSIPAGMPGWNTV
jgi:hypothetical protein